MLTLIRGLPGSGKTTLASDLRFSLSTRGEVDHFEADMYFEDENGNYNFDRTKLREAHVWCQEQTRMSLKAGKIVIVSNTFTTTKELQPYFDIAATFGITPSVYLTQNDWGSIHNVPTETLNEMRKRFVFDLSTLFATHAKKVEK